MSQGYAGLGVLGPLNGGSGTSTLFTRGNTLYAGSGGIYTQSNTIFDVKVYGALGNDATDDTTAIQSAITAAASGGIVYFPPGTYRVTSLTVSVAGVSLVGAGPFASIIRTTSTTANVLTLGNAGTPVIPGSSVMNLTFDTAVTRTAGYFISISGQESYVLSNLYLGAVSNNNPGNFDSGGGISFGTANPALAYVSDVTIETRGPFNGMLINSSNGDKFFQGLHLRGPVYNGGTVAGSIGISCTSSGGDFFSDVDVVQYERGVYLNGAVNWSKFHNVLCDTNSLTGFDLAGTTPTGIVFDHCWAGTNGITVVNARGWQLTSGTGIMLHGCRCINNGGHGIEIDTGVTDTEIIGGIITGNGQQASNTYDGIATQANTTGMRIQGVRSGQTVGQANQQRYGINISNTSDNFIVTGCDTRTNNTGGFNNPSGTSATKVAANNI